MKQLTISIIIAGSMVASASAQDTIIGFTLGQVVPRTFEACQDGTTNRTSDFCESYGMRKEPGQPGDVFSLRKPFDADHLNIPSWLASPRDKLHASITLITDADAKIEKISLEFGIRRTDDVIETIQKKYGQPTSDSIVEAQTRAGTKFKFRTAAWKLEKIFIATDCRSLDYCSASFTTTEAIQKSQARRGLQKNKDNL